MAKAVYGHFPVADPLTAAQLAAARARIAELEAQVATMRIELDFLTVGDQAAADLLSV
ncbi:MAG: hypothetical protein ACOYEV_05480 [Candidatus Nanopelagicales bacterium]